MTNKKPPTPKKDDDKKLDPRRLASIAGATAAVAVMFAIGHHYVPVFFPEWYIEADQPEPRPGPVQPSSSGERPASGPATNDGSQAEIEKIVKTSSADATASLRSLAILADKVPSASARAAEAATKIRNDPKLKAKVAAADAAAAAEIAALGTRVAPRLVDFEHVAVAELYRELEERYAGLSAAEKASAERVRIERAWVETPSSERDAKDAWKKLPAIDPTDASAALALAETAKKIHDDYPGSVYGDRADKRWRALVEPLVKSIEDGAAKDPDGTLAAADKLPAWIAESDFQKRIDEARKTARARLDAATLSAAGPRIAELRKLRALGDYDGALAIVAKLPAAQQPDEKAAIELFVKIRKARVAIPAGDALVGLEGALKPVHVDAFMMDTYEVSNRVYAVFLRETAHSKLDVDAKSMALPVTNISQREALACARWLGGRLPTAIEWERAARGTDGRPYPWGKKWDAKLLNCTSAVLHPSGDFPKGASPAGCMDMAGNAAEWTSTFDSGQVAVKGGSRRDLEPDQFTAGAVVWLSPDKRDPVIGFRCAWDAK